MIQVNDWTEVADFILNIHKGICPICEQPMEQRQNGRCVYAEPCGHRLFQGMAQGTDQDGYERDIGEDMTAAQSGSGGPIARSDR